MTSFEAKETDISEKVRIEHLNYYRVFIKFVPLYVACFQVIQQFNPSVIQFLCYKGTTPEHSGKLMKPSVTAYKGYDSGGKQETSCSIMISRKIKLRIEQKE